MQISVVGNVMYKMAPNSNSNSQILFWADNTTKKNDRGAAGTGAAGLAVTEEELQTLQPPRDELHGSAFRLDIV